VGIGDGSSGARWGGSGSGRVSREDSPPADTVADEWGADTSEGEGVSRLHADSVRRAVEVVYEIWKRHMRRYDERRKDER
jgi:hypothetical protein